MSRPAVVRCFSGVSKKTLQDLQKVLEDKKSESDEDSELSDAIGRLISLTQDAHDENGDVEKD